MPENTDKKSFWTSLPGILSGIAALLTAIGGIIALSFQLGWIGPKGLGGILIGSEPPGAQVFLDNKPIGSTTAGMLRIKDLKTGRYSLRVTKVGFKPWEKTVDVEPQRDYSVLAELEPSSRLSASDVKQATVNDIRNFHAVSVSDQEAQITIDYVYVGNFGTTEPVIVASALQNNGGEVPGMVYRHARAKVGQGTAAVSLFANFQSGAYVTTTIKVCIVDTSRKANPFCKTFPFQKTWIASPGLVGRQNDIRNFRAESASDADLPVTVDYTYIGDHGRGLRYVYMSAVALQDDGTQVPRTHFEGFGGPGEVRVGDGIATMLIKKSSGGGATSTKVRICLISREPFQEIVCKQFPFRKEWR